MLKEGVRQEIAKARAAADVQTFNMDGSPMRATDSAVPPPAPAKSAPGLRPDPLQRAAPSGGVRGGARRMA